MKNQEKATLSISSIPCIYFSPTWRYKQALMIYQAGAVKISREHFPIFYHITNMLHCFADISNVSLPLKSL